MPISHVATMAFERVSRLASIPALCLALTAWAMTAVQACAIGLIRDPDIEHGLRELAFPILRSAGLNTNRVRIMVVSDMTFNAFVIDYNTIYLNSGLILTVDSAEMLQAVIAHEAAHIANGHLARRTANLEAAQRKAMLGNAIA
ncbi:MAG: M48 family metalloprotease, partial [Ruegeria sp.]